MIDDLDHVTLPALRVLLLIFISAVTLN